MILLNNLKVSFNNDENNLCLNETKNSYNNYPIMNENKKKKDENMEPDYDFDKKLKNDEINFSYNMENITKDRYLDHKESLTYHESYEKMNYAFLEEELNDMIKNSDCSKNFNLFNKNNKDNFLLECEEEIDNLVFMDK
jgi:hypothetical protein